jgi:hypothetical protein
MSSADHTHIKYHIQCVSYRGSLTESSLTVMVMLQPTSPYIVVVVVVVVVEADCEEVGVNTDEPRYPLLSIATMVVVVA